MYEELIVALNKYFEGYELKRGDALKAAEAIHKLEKSLDKYAEAARVIVLHLKDFCNKNFPYDEMIADAARNAAAELEQVKQERDAAVADMRQQLCLVCKKFKTCRPRRKVIDDGNCAAFEWRGVAKEETT